MKSPQQNQRNVRAPFGENRDPFSLQSLRGTQANTSTSSLSSLDSARAPQIQLLTNIIQDVLDMIGDDDDF